MVNSSRFDLAAAKEEERLRRSREKTKKIVSNVVLVLVLIGLAIGGKIGWDKFSEYREQKAAEEQRMRDEEAARERAAKLKAEQERKAELERREAEKKEREAKKEAERKAREEAREQARIRQQQEREAREQKAREEKELKIRQKEFKEYAAKVVADVSFDLGDRITTAPGDDSLITVECTDKRWEQLKGYARSGCEIDFFDLLRGTTVTNSFGFSNFPDQATIAKLLENLDKEKFMMTVKLADVAAVKLHPELLAPNLENGLDLPPGAREIREGKKVIGWTVPFRYGDKAPIFLMRTPTADQLCREWSKVRSKIFKQSAKLDNKDEFRKGKLTDELAGFVESVKLEMKNPPVAPEEEKPQVKVEQPRKPKMTMKGPGENGRNNNGNSMKSLKGPSQR